MNERVKGIIQAAGVIVFAFAAIGGSGTPAAAGEATPAAKPQPDQIAVERFAPQSSAEQIAWGNWGNWHNGGWHNGGWHNWGNGGWGNGWHNGGWGNGWHNWGNGWHNWGNGWHNWGNGNWINIQI